MGNPLSKKSIPTIDEITDPRHSALLIVDVQNDYCAQGGYFHSFGKDISMAREMIPILIKFVKETRRLGIRIIWIQNTTFVEGCSDSAAWIYYKTRDGKSPDYCIKGTWGHEFVDGLEPQDGEMVVQKFRFSAFTKTSLDLLLRVNGIKTVIVSGVVTQGCVEATVRDASYYDYFAVVVKDCVASTSREFHESSLKSMAVRYDILSSDELLSRWEAKIICTTSAK